MTTSTRSLASAGKTASRSSGVRVSTGMSVTAIAAAAVSISRRWLRSLTLVGFTSSPILVAPGIRSRANSSCFAGSPGRDVNSPVTLPPGLASLFIKPQADRVVEQRTHDRDHFRGVFSSLNVSRHDHVGAASYHFFSKRREALQLALGPSIFHLEVAALGIAKRAHGFDEGVGDLRGSSGPASPQNADTRAPGRCLGEWPCRRRAAEERDERAPPHVEHRGRPPACRSVYRTLNLPHDGRQVLGADLNCSESRR